MIPVNSWVHRPMEEANLFNPAFVGSLIYEFVKVYQKSKSEGAPLTYVPISLSLSLHRPSRARLPRSTVTSLYQWVQNNEDVLVDFHTRLMGLLPYVREAVQFSMKRQSM